MIFNISSRNSNINWNAQGDERIAQNVVNILNTVQYEVAYDRIMGRNSNNLDRNFKEVESILIAETYDLIEEYEPRAKVINVLVNQLENGEIDIRAVIEIE